MAALFAVLSSSLLAQNATIQGIVKDQSEALIPGVAVTITNIDTGLRREATTNEAGFYTVPTLPVGRYKLSAAVQGFSTSEVPEVKVDVAQVARVDFTLQPGTLTESVQVEATAAMLDSETATVGQVIDNKRIVELPLNGRNYLELARLTAGTAPARGSRPASEGVFSAGGQHGYQVQVNIDGVDNSATYSGGPVGYEAQAVKPSVDSVGEFRVVTNNLSAEYGNRMGGHVFVNIKSGTNQFHGTMFEFLRNSALDGTNFFANRSGAGKPPYKQNQFGGTFGGPIRKDKTFFFASYEGTRTRLGRSFTSTVPTLLMREGNFSQVRPIFDPATTVGTPTNFTRQQFPGNIIPKDRWDPLFPKLLSLYPLPTNGDVVNNYFYSPTESNDVDVLDFKGDHNINDKNRLSLRYSRRSRDRFEPGPLPLPADGGLGTTTVIRTNSVALSLNSTLTAATANEFRFSITDFPTRFDIPFDRALYDDYGIKGIPKTTFAESNNHGLSRFTPAGYAEIGSRSFWPNVNNMKTYQLNDTLYANIGKHNIRYGAEFRRENVFRNAARYSRGQFAFNREFTTNPANRGNTGDGLAEFMLGLAAGGTVGNENTENLWANTVALFVQDDWKISPRLTLNLGVRYDVFFAPTAPNSKVSTFDLDFNNIGPDARLRQIRPADRNDCLCRNDLNNFAPRLGLAWKPTQKTVVRAGAGIIYARADALQTQWARFQNQSPDFIEIGFATVDRINPRLTLSGGFPAVTLPATEIPGPNLISIDAPNPYLPTQYSQQWFFDIQRELPFDTLLTVGYNGNGTRKMLTGVNYSIPFNIEPSPVPLANRRLWPFYSSVNRVEPLGSLSYNGLLMKIEKRFSKGLTFLSSYTWAHAIDNLDETGNNDAGGAGVKPWDRSLNRGPALTDVRHNYILSATWELPVGRKRAFLGSINRFADAIVGGWQISGIFSRVSGLPFTVTTSGGITNAGGADRPNRIRDGALPADQRTIDRWFDVDAFQVQPQYTYGNSGRNILNGPWLNNLDMSIAKAFSITERWRLQFRAEAFNATNTPYFGLPAANINGLGAGRITSAGEPRRVQFGLKLLF